MSYLKWRADYNLRFNENIIEAFRTKTLPIENFNVALGCHMEHGNLKCIITLLNLGIKVTQKFPGGSYGLSPVINGRAPENIRTLIFHPSIIKSMEEEPGIKMDVLKECIFKNYTDIFDFLLENGFTANSTTMSYAVRSSSPYFVDKHLSLGINGNPDYGHTRWGIALNYLCKYGKHDLALKLILHGADVNIKNESTFISDEVGLTPLMYGVKYADIVRDLIAFGADVNITDERGQNVLFYVNQSYDSLKVLLRAGARIDLINNEGKTILHYALSKCYEYSFFEIIVSTVSIKPLINIKDNNGETIFTLFARNYNRMGPNKDKLLKDLIDMGSDINSQDNDGNTPLMRSIIYRSRNITELLLKLGANVNIQNNVGRTALMLICIESINVIDLLNLFIKYGADITIRERKGRTAGYFAWSKYREEARELLRYNDQLTPNTQNNFYQRLMNILHIGIW